MKLKYFSVVVLSAFLLSGCFSKGTKPKPVAQAPIPTKIPTPTPQETQLNPEERPDISLLPDDDLHNVQLKITKLPADVTTVDYELVYVSDDLPRGVIGTYSVSKGVANLLLGSCSSGICKYDKNITDGQLTIKYRTNGKRVLLREPLVLPQDKNE